MSIQQRNLERLQLASCHPTAARSATGVGSAVDVLDYDGDLLFVLDSAAGTGTTPTLDVTITASDTSGGTYTAISGAAFTQVTGTASQQKLAISKDDVKRYLKVAYTISGTTPSFTFSVNAVGSKKYV
jgi:hypothetical protein